MMTDELTALDVRTSIDRQSAEVVRRQAEQFLRTRDVRELLDAVPGILLVLNSCRQVVFANRALMHFLGIGRVEDIYGRRPGEIFDCEHAFEQSGGCGCGEACGTCGAARAIAHCERGAASVQECRITQKTAAALNLRVSTTPFHVADVEFTLMALTDISHEKRRAALERIFFHDLLNTAGALYGNVSLLADARPVEVPELSSTLGRLSETLVDEIRAQRELSAAESGDLPVRWETVRTRFVVRTVLDAYARQEMAADKTLRIDPAAADITFTSDRILLTRVLGNMVKNALEASAAGQTVTAGCDAAGEHVEFWVHNAGTMPRDVRLQVFQQSFSTKGPGRGLGAYSIKLLTERYLKGSVSFTTSVEQGTTFRVRYPLHP